MRLLIIGFLSNQGTGIINVGEVEPADANRLAQETLCRVSSGKLDTERVRAVPIHMNSNDIVYAIVDQRCDVPRGIEWDLIVDNKADIPELVLKGLSNLMTVARSFSQR